MHRYCVVIERAERNFAGHVPDLPGCVATGPSEVETRRLLDEAIAFHLEGMRADGLLIPRPSQED